MKNLSNAIQDPFDLNVVNTLTVGNDLDVEDNINTTSINTTTITTSTLDALSITSGGVNTSVINFGLSPFTYLKGTFTPLSQTLESDGTTFTLRNWHDPSGQSGSGCYIKYGNLVTVYYQATVNFGGVLNDFIHSLRIPVISNLPFECAATGASVIHSEVVSEQSFPNGYAGGVAAPLTILMDGNYVANIYESGSLFQAALPPIYTPGATWVSDGRTAIITCAQSQYAPPPLNLVIFSGLEGPANNFNVITTGSYTSSFKGSITYFTNE